VEKIFTIKGSKSLFHMYIILRGKIVPHLQAFTHGLYYDTLSALLPLHCEELVQLCAAQTSAPEVKPSSTVASVSAVVARINTDNKPAASASIHLESTVGGYANIVQASSFCCYCCFCYCFHFIVILILAAKMPLISVIIIIIIIIIVVVVVVVNIV
jgi:hypothetical protein